MKRANLLGTMQTLLLASLAMVPLALHAQAFPSKPVRLVVTYPAGGSSDLMARIMGQKLSVIWNQPVIIESKPGAAGAIGMDFTARQPGDGYTFVIGNLGPALVNPLLNKVPYDMERDFVPVSLVATGPNILAVPVASPYKTLAELMAAARAKPGTVSFGTSGPGSMAHLGGELMMRQGRIRINHIPYKGGGQAVNDLLAGQIDMMVSDALPVSQFLKTGRLRALAITSGKRSPLFPDIPTFAEAGLNGLVAENWWGVYLPTGTPKPIIDSYRSALVKVMAEPDLKEKFAGLGVEAQASTQEEFRAFLVAEHARYTRLIADNNIKGE